MRYRYGRGVTKKPRKKQPVFLIVLPVVLLAGVYGAITAAAPMLGFLGGPSDTIASRILSTHPGELSDRIFLPQINVDIPIAQGSNPESLDKGAWLRHPQNGTPESGGNFVLSARKFSLGTTPAHTRALSPLFRVDELKVGDEIFVDYDGTRYVYEITATHFHVKRAAADIEQSSKESKLTLYTYDGEGLSERDIIEATATGRVVWGDEPRVRYFDEEGWEF